MKNKPGLYLFLITLTLAVYYLFCGIYLSKLGYFNGESLFYVEKAKIVFEGIDSRIKVMGLTAPILPFYATFLFTTIDYLLAPVIASAIGTAMLFYMIAGMFVKRFKDDFYLILLLVLFLFHPGLLYTACSGKSIYLVLIFFFLFFSNILRFYESNTTYHVSIASICLVVLTFCDYKFIWLTLFFVPLVLSITVQSLNLSEKESIFRLFLSFNSPSLRRKLVNKTFALYLIIFILPIASIACYKLLNLTHANDLNYFIESPYATWSVIDDKVNYDLLTVATDYKIPETSVLLSLRILLFCPLMLFAIYLFKNSTYKVLTLITPFAFVEFLHIKYAKVLVAHEYYLIFLVLALLCIIYKAQTIKNQKALKIVLSITIVLQLYTGYIFLKKSLVKDEQSFITVLSSRKDDEGQYENRDVANFINSLPDGSRVLVDDAIAYQIVAFTSNVRKLTLPYQENFTSAIESPNKYDNYLLIATSKNAVSGYTQLNSKYLLLIKQSDNNLTLQKVYETVNWGLYKIL